MDRSRKRRPAKRRKRRAGRMLFFIGSIVFILLFAAGLVFYIKRYAPTDEHMDLSEYYRLDNDDSAVVIIDGEYITVNEENDYGLLLGENAYIALETVKEHLDNGYVFDDAEGILRYATDAEIVSARLDETGFTVGKDTQTLASPIAVKAHERVFLAADFLRQFTDFHYTLYADAPARIVIETAGYERTVGALRGMGYSFLPMLVSVGGVCGLRILWLAVMFSMPQFHTENVMYAAYPLSWGVSFLILLVSYLILINRLKRKNSKVDV